MFINRIQPIEMTTADAATIALGVWTPLHAGLDKPIAILRIVNSSNSDIYISYDGTHPHDFLYAGDILQLEFQANNIIPSNSALLAKNTGIYISGNAGVGTIYFSGFSTYKE